VVLLLWVWGQVAQPAADPLYLRKRSLEKEVGSQDSSNKRARLETMTLKER